MQSVQVSNFVLHSLKTIKFLSADQKKKSCKYDFLHTKVNAMHTLISSNSNNILITNRYFFSVVQKHFDSSGTIKLHQHYDTIADGSKQIVLVNQLKYITVTKSTHLQHAEHRTEKQIYTHHTIHIHISKQNNNSFDT